MNEVTITLTKLTITQNHAERTTDFEPVVLQNHYGLRLDADLSSSGVQKSRSLTKQGEVYCYVYKDKMRHGKLYLNLRQSKKRCQKRVNRNKRRCLISYAISIDKRPKIVDNRTRFGDFKMDTVIGANHKQTLVTIVERKSGLTFIKKVPNRTAELVSKAIVE